MKNYDFGIKKNLNELSVKHRLQSLAKIDGGRSKKKKPPSIDALCIDW